MSDHYPIELLIRSSRAAAPISTSYDETASYVESVSSATSAGVRVGAFNVRVFGRSKVANVDNLNILVQVCCRHFKYFIVDMAPSSESN